MATVSFKKGLLENLPQTYSEGTFYVTTDEHALYLDVDSSTRVRIGDFQEFDNLEALQQNTNPSTTALYYVKDLNVLAKWNGKAYVQINLDTGATSVEVVGSGNAVTAATYDAGTRKMTLTMGTTFATPSDVDGKIAAKVGDLGESTVKQYVDDKVADVVAGSIDGLGALASKDTVAETDLHTALAAKINAKADATDVADDIAAAKAEVVGTTGDLSSADTIGGAKKYAEEKAAAAQSAVETKIGTVDKGKTVVQMIGEAQEAATYDDTELSGRVTAAEGKINTLVGSDSGKSVRTIANEELAAQLIPEGADESLDTLQEIAAWIQSHPDDAAAMNAAIAALQAQLNGIDAGDGTVKKYVDDAIAALSIGDYAKAADLTALAGRVTTLESATHTHANKDVLDGIDASKVSAWDAAEQNAKSYADGLAVNYDAAGAADAAEGNAKGYTDQMLTWGSF